MAIKGAHKMSTTYKKIVVPLDGSELAAQALPRAEEIAQQTGAQIILLRVLESSPAYMAALPTAGATGIVSGVGVTSPGFVTLDSDGAPYRQAIDDVQQSLDELAASLKHRKVEAKAEIDTGDPATQIAHYAATHDVDLIVMSSHGRTGLARLTHGSVANKVRQTAPCEVMVVRPTFSESNGASSA
jgi:nucleotide-binding universal stress UspA family protein